MALGKLSMQGPNYGINVSEEACQYFGCFVWILTMIMTENHTQMKKQQQHYLNFIFKYTIDGLYERIRQ